MTGILPIKKYKTQSALNNFLEYSMVEPRRMAQYFGFTKSEVQALTIKHGLDFDEFEKWYDGYQIGDELSMFNPNSVIQAIDSGRCRSFCASTGSFDTVADYIQMNYEGLKDDIISMLAGGRRLRQFSKILLQPGEKRTVSFQLPASDLAFVGYDGRWTLEEGDFILCVDTLTQKIHCDQTYTW